MKVKNLGKRFWHSCYAVSQRSVAVPVAGYGGRTGAQKVQPVCSTIEHYMCAFLGSGSQCTSCIVIGVNYPYVCMLILICD